MVRSCRTRKNGLKWIRFIVADTASFKVSQTCGTLKDNVVSISF